MEKMTKTFFINIFINILIFILMNTKYLYFLFIAFFLVSCNNEDIIKDDSDNGNVTYKNYLKLSPEEFMSVVYDEGDKELTEEETLEILNDFIETGKTKSNSNVSFEMDEKFVLDLNQNTKTKSASNTSVSKIGFHKYNVKTATKSGTASDQEGFAIVCADKRFPNVLAYVEKGQLEKSNESGALILIENAKILALKNIATIEHLEDSLRKQTIEKINKFSGSDEFDLDKCLDKIAVDKDSQSQNIALTKGFSTTPSGTLVSQVGPLTSNVKWDQTYPHNMYVKSTVGTSEEGYFPSEYKTFYPAGCVVVAMAQIAAYYRPSISVPKYGTINWTQVLTSPYISSDVNSVQTKQIAAIMEAIATGSSTSFGPNGGSTNSQNARNFMSNWGIYMNNPGACNFQNMKAPLDELKLIYTTGTCRRIGSYSYSFDNMALPEVATKAYTNGSHAWVTDGYQIRQRGTRQILLQYNVWSSVNFGWGGSYSGWYLFESNGNISYSVGWGDFMPYDIYDINLSAYPYVRKQ